MGWEPLTPIDMPGGQSTSDTAVTNMQTAICFRRKNNNSSQENLAISHDDIANLVALQYPNTLGVERHDCLCLETYGENYLGFHDVPNALLLDLIQCVNLDWQAGLSGISESVYNVISDYSVDGEMSVIAGSMMDERRYMQLNGSPWSQSEEGTDLEDAI